MLDIEECNHSFYYADKDFISQMRVHAPMQTMDPEGVAMRRFSLTLRALYRVSGPLALWHIERELQRLLQS